MLLDPPPPPPPDGGANGLENSVESSSSSSMCTVVVVVVSCKDPPPAFDPPHAPPPPSPVCWNGFPLLLIFLHDRRIYKEREKRENLRSKRLLFNGLSSTNRFTNFSKSRAPRISSSLCPPPQRDSRFGEESCVVLSTNAFFFARACFLCVFARYYEDQSVLSFLSSLLLNSVKRRI